MQPAAVLPVAVVSCANSHLSPIPHSTTHPPTLTHLQVEHFRRAWEESERTHALRAQAEQALKEEIAVLQGTSKLVNTDLLYLRSVVISGYESGELPSDNHMFQVGARGLLGGWGAASAGAGAGAGSVGARGLLGGCWGWRRGW